MFLRGGFRRIALLGTLLIASSATASELLVGASGGYFQSSFTGGVGTAESVYRGPSFGMDLRYQFSPGSGVFDTAFGITLGMNYRWDLGSNVGSGLDETGRIKGFGALLDFNFHVLYLGLQYRSNTASFTPSGGTETEISYSTYGLRGGIGFAAAKSMVVSIGGEVSLGSAFPSTNPGLNVVTSNSQWNVGITVLYRLMQGGLF